MNSDDVVQSLQKGFRITLGAATFLVDLLQYPNRRDENLVRLRTELTRLTEEWEVKGEQTEQEARNFVDTVLSQQVNQSNQSAGSSTTSTSATPFTPVTSPDVQSDLKELTAQISAIRMELERLREQDS